MYNHGHKIVKHFKILMWLNLPQVKRYMKSSNILYELAHELPNYLRPRIIGNLEIMGKTRKWVGAEFNSQSPIQKKNFGISGQKLHKNRYIKVSRPVQFSLIS